MVDRKRDFQKSKVYRWENANIAPHDKSRVSFDQIQEIVNYVWEGEGLKYPPRVEPFPKQVTTKCGDATRLVIRFHEEELTPTWVVLHEIAHSLTSTHDGERMDRHGPDFVGIYMQLVEKHLGIPQAVLWHTASMEKVKYNIGSQAYIVDRKEA